MSKISIETFYPASISDWREWLVKNHKSKDAIWVIYYKKDSGVPSIRWEEAVEEALCFGWIDSRRQPIDSEKFRQYYSKRKPKGNWSRISKPPPLKTEALISD